MFARTPVITIRSSLDALRLKLWDEERRSLVRFSAVRERSGLSKALARGLGSLDTTRS